MENQLEKDEPTNNIDWERPERKEEISKIFVLKLREETILLSTVVNSV